MSRTGLTMLAPLVALSLACAGTEPTAPSQPLPHPLEAAATATGFHWISATPESQGMCGSTLQLGCTRTLDQIWTSLSNPMFNTKQLIVIRNDRVIYTRGGGLRYRAFSASKGLLGAPALVYAMSRCGVSLTDPASRWLGHEDGARWLTTFPWTDITVEQLASHTSGVCDHENTSTVCRNESPRWWTDYDKARQGGLTRAYPKDMFTIARARSEQNREPALPPGSTFEYSNVGHALLNYVVQRACDLKLTDIYDQYIRQPGMGIPAGVPLIYTDGGAIYNQSTGIARWKGIDGAAVLRLAARQGIWDNRNVEPVHDWNLVTKITGNPPAAAAFGWGVVYHNNSTDIWTASAGHRRLSPQTFGHGGSYSNVFLVDPLTSTIIVRQGEDNANGASYLTLNGCAPGWTGTAPTCTSGTDWSNNWDVPAGAPNAATMGPRFRVVEPLQEAFFFPPPFCRMTSAGGMPVDQTTDVYAGPAGDSTIDLEAEITVNPREDDGSSVPDQVVFYKESDGGVTTGIGNGTPVPGTSPARYRLAYPAESHGAIGDVRTYFASCIAKSVQDGTKKVPSYAEPVRVSRN